ncbi:protein of unknown function DUF4373 [Vibrio phage 1.154.O._10N.222.52.B12]|nr:protein of unknown function DUF4373 [Vibrio phage 1.154.O._10N.222.52.B12]
MKWFKHDTDANQDAKLQNVLLDYGLEGYGLYWYCIEQIAGKVDKDNITFELEHDARIIARNTGSTPQKIEEMMRYFVSVGLFENTSGLITCLKLAKRLDKSMTSNSEMRAIIENLKNQNHDGVMTESCLSHDGVMQEEKRGDIDKNKDLFVEEESPTKKKYNFDRAHMNFAQCMYTKIREVMPRAKEPNFEKWAHEVRLAANALDVSLTDLWNVFLWANSDGFWKTNILSPSNLRDKFPQLEVKRNEAGKPNGGQGTPSATKPPLTEGQRLRIQLNQERAARGEPPIDWSRQ